MNKIFSSFRNKALIFGALSILLAVLIELVQHNTYEPPVDIAAKAEESLQHKEKRIIEHLKNLATLSSNEAIKETIFNEHYKANSQNISAFAYFKDSLIAWSDNDILILPDTASVSPEARLERLKNGWYEIIRHSNGNYHFYAALLIKNEFAYQNKYLANRFNSFLHIPANYNFISAGSHEPNAIPVKSGILRTNGGVAFYISRINDTDTIQPYTPGFWLYMLVGLLALLAIYFAGRHFLNSSLAVTIAFTITVLALRGLMIYLHLPDELYSRALFSPGLYASYNYMNSLGDFLLNVLLVLALTLVFIRVKPVSPGARLNRIIMGLILVLFVIVLNALTRGLVFNSNINFNTSNVFEMNAYSIVGILITAVLMLIFFLLTGKFSEMQAKKSPIIPITAGILLIVVALIFQRFMLAATFLFAVLLFTAVYIFTRQAGSRFTLVANITFLFLTSCYVSCSVYYHTHVKEQEHRKLLASKIETEQDRIAEHVFEEVESKISSDTTLQNFFTNQANAVPLISQRLHRRYFNGYWTKYEMDSYCFDSLNRPLNRILDSTSYSQFQNIIHTIGKPTYAEDLFFLTDLKGKSMYLARVALFRTEWGVGSRESVNQNGSFSQLPTSNSQLIGTIFIELEPKLIQATQGFPELFISDKVPYNRDLANYSYAKYKSGELINRYGDFNYYFSSSAFNLAPGETSGETGYTFTDKDGFNHLLYRDNQNLVVVSKKQDSVYTLVTCFSYFFACYALLLLIYIVGRSLIYWLPHLKFNLSLKNRIQVSVIAIVIISVTVIGIGTVVYIIKKYDVNQSVRIAEELNSLLVNIQSDLNSQQPTLPSTDGQSGGQPDTALTEDLIYKLSRLSSNPSNNFNWYDTDGSLLFSSQPKIFDQGIVSTIMNPKAFDELADRKQTQYVQPEYIGKLKYIAAYQPLTNRNNQLLGFISLPYFEKESELNKDISAFLSALINIYVLLLSLTVLLTFFIASRITQPLLLIQEKLAHLHLGKPNEYIQWNKHDEIGELVKEYNKKVEELAYSAELLAQSERETAWQEMAKQVAHEIKNPLTPMKLGIQHLLSAYKNESPDKEELVMKICETILQQIDALTNIANAFSHFARMPKAKNEVLDLCSVLNDTIILFKQTPSVTINFKNLRNVACEVFADKDQLIRVFSNLLKNAIQSVPENRPGFIEVTLSKADVLSQDFNENNEAFTIAFKDNGSGIPENQVEKIFTPNFTTKTGGMGLGLAIVKNIIENLGGKVEFKTQIGVGTTFFVTLPAIS